MFFQILLLVTGLWTCSGQNLSFNNPISDSGSEMRYTYKPFAYKLGSDYYWVEDSDLKSELILKKSPILTNFRDAESKAIFESTPDFPVTTAGPMHLIDGELYVYLVRMIFRSQIFVMRAKNASDPMGEWWYPEPLFQHADPSFEFGGTVMRHGGKNYFVWSAWIDQGDETPMLIAEMYSPNNVSDRRVVIRHPDQRWECRDTGLSQKGVVPAFLEGANVPRKAQMCENYTPMFMYSNDTSYLLFSVGDASTPEASLALMSISFDKDPMDPNNWELVGPVFETNEEENVFGPAYASFVESPDNSETWMVYTAKETSANTRNARTVRLDKINWAADGSPVFPRAHGYNNSQPVPSGQTEV